MGMNDAAEQLEVAKAEVVRLEHHIHEMEGVAAERDALAARLEEECAGSNALHAQLLEARASSAGLAAKLNAIRNYVTQEQFYLERVHRCYSQTDFSKPLVEAKKLLAILGSVPGDLLETVKAEAWDEGFEAATDAVGAEFWASEWDRTLNPYRLVKREQEQSNG